MKTTQATSFIEVYSGINRMTTKLRNILKKADIDALVMVKNIEPTSPFYCLPKDSTCIKVLVSNLDLDKATPIVAEFEKKYGK